MYPVTERKRGIGGTVVVKFVIDTSGRPDSITIAKSSDSFALDEAARDAVAKSECRPYIEDGVVKRITTQVPFVFQPNDSGPPLSPALSASSMKNKIDAAAMQNAGIEPGSAKAATFARWTQRADTDPDIGTLLGDGPDRAGAIMLDASQRATFFAGGVLSISPEGRSMLLALTLRMRDTTPPDCGRTKTAPLVMAGNLPLAKMSDADFASYLDITFDILKQAALRTGPATVTVEQRARADEAVAQTLRARTKKESISASWADAVKGSAEAQCKNVGVHARALLETPQPFRDWSLVAETRKAQGLPPSAMTTAAWEGYATKVQRRVRPNIVWSGPSAGRETSIAVSCAPNGTVLSTSIVRSSGNADWDAAALRAVQRSSPMPLDIDGKAPPKFTISMRPSP
ncbi:TonB family protein [Caballeronia humi]|uniref:TolA-related transport transmembrane protein n=1 Tax=Caballeronia humi TaxID=326474 RepID=A0A158F6T1_9BURK|nr:TonB family protein [Caballeronia humi]SAL15586.1 TolA-related transport transmembrane protein [Caballeronia humi]